MLTETSTKTPLPDAPVNSWSNFLHATTCSGESDSDPWLS